MKRALTAAFVLVVALALGAPAALAASGPAHNIRTVRPTPTISPSRSTTAMRSFAGYAPPSVTTAFPPRTSGIGRSLQVIPSYIGAIQLPASGDVSGTLSGGVPSETDDVYYFYLEQGAEIETTLTATPGSLTNFYIYPPGTTNLDLDPAWVAVYDHVYPQPVDFISPASGYYYLDVQETGSSTAAYNVPWDMRMSPNDDIHPGPDDTAPRVTASPMADWLDDNWDWADVSSIPLRAGDKLTMHLAAGANDDNSPNFDADLLLYAPSVSTIYPSTLPVAFSAALGTNEDVAYAAPTTGTYYIASEIYTGRGATSLSWSVNPIRPSIARTPSAAKLTYKRKAKFTLGARFTDQFGFPIKGQYVYLQKSSNGKKWSNAFKIKTNSNGAVGVKFTAKSKGKVYFRWYRAKTSTSKAVYSSSQRVTIK